jgi:hypothetical protein
VSAAPAVPCPRRCWQHQHHVGLSPAGEPTGTLPRLLLCYAVSQGGTSFDVVTTLCYTYPYSTATTPIISQPGSAPISQPGSAPNCWELHLQRPLRMSHLHASDTQIEFSCPPSLSHHCKGTSSTYTNIESSIRQRSAWRPTLCWRCGDSQATLLSVESYCLVSLQFSHVLHSNGQDSCYLAPGMFGELAAQQHATSQRLQHAFAAPGQWPQLQQTSLAAAIPNIYVYRLGRQHFASAQVQHTTCTRTNSASGEAHSTVHALLHQLPVSQQSQRPCDAAVALSTGHCVCTLATA